MSTRPRIFRSTRLAAALLAVGALLGGCVTAPKPLQGAFAPLRPQDAAAQPAAGEVVRWGGRIVSVHPEAGRSCFEVVGVPLGSSGRPRRIDTSEGRFFACRAGFYDPEVFQPGREVTITGHVEGVDVRKVGDYDYRYPRVAADVIYLWPELRREDMYPYSYPYFYGGIGYRRGWGYGYPYWW
jgi:outer membrane lipoprotein